MLKPVECDPSPRPEGPEGWCGVEGCSYLHQHQGASFPRASGSVLGKGRRWTGLASGEGEAGMGMATPTLPNRAGTSLGIRMKALVPLPSGEQFSHSCALGAPRPRCPPQLFPPCTCPGPEITQPFDGRTGMGWTWICSTGPVTSPPEQVRTAGSSNGHLCPVELTLDLCRDDTWGPGMWRASSETHGYWHCPGKRAFWIFSKGSSQRWWEWALGLALVRRGMAVRVLCRETEDRREWWTAGAGVSWAPRRCQALYRQLVMVGRRHNVPVICGRQRIS